MTSEVETRRFRTWDESSTGSTAPHRVIFRYQYIRLWGSWPGIVMTVLLAIFALYVVGYSSYELTSSEPGNGVAYENWFGGPLMFVGPAVLLCALFGAPLFAEDLRFNAPLFYFSRPLRAKSYFLGKAGFLASMVAGAAVVPIVILMLLALVVGIPNTTLPDAQWVNPAQRSDYLADFATRHIDTVPEWLAATAITLPPILLILAFLVSITLLASVYTRRGWHASMAFAAVLAGMSMVHGSVADSDLPALDLLGPAGWINIMVYVPLQMVFEPDLDDPSSYYYSDNNPAVANSGWLIPAAYILVTALTAVALWASYRRLNKQEAVL